MRRLRYVLAIRGKTEPFKNSALCFISATLLKLCLAFLHGERHVCVFKPTALQKLLLYMCFTFNLLEIFAIILWDKRAFSVFHKYYFNTIGLWRAFMTLPRIVAFHTHRESDRERLVLWKPTTFMKSELRRTGSDHLGPIFHL